MSTSFDYEMSKIWQSWNNKDPEYLNPLSYQYETSTKYVTLIEIEGQNCMDICLK